MITDDIMITLTGALTTTLIIMLMMMRNAVHRQRLNKCLDTLESAKRSKYDALHFQALKNTIKPTCLGNGNSAAATFKLTLQILFGIAVLLGFSWWTYHLFTKGIITWAVVSAVYAVIGLILPFLAWREIKRRNEIKGRVSRTLENFERSLEKSAKPAKQNATVDTSKPAVRAEAAKSISLPAKIDVPEDSVLRRHLLTQLRAEIEASLFPRPTDCVLRRHYEQLVEASLEDRLLDPSALDRFKQIDGIDTETQAIPAPVQRVADKEAARAQPVSASSKHEVPEDSVLRRHLLTQLRSEIESSLFPSPTDCVLKRHYDQLIESELEQRLVDPERLKNYKIIDGLEFEAASLVSATIVPKATEKTSIRDESAVSFGAESQKCSIPEDSVLRRHFMTQLRAEIESSLFPRPSDSVLQRHYEQLIESELEMRLG